MQDVPSLLCAIDNPDVARSQKRPQLEQSGNGRVFRGGITYHYRYLRMPYSNFATPTAIGLHAFTLNRVRQAVLLVGLLDPHLDKSSIELIHEFAGRKRARVEKDCPPEILVQSRTEFVNGTFWDAIVAGATIVCFNSPFDLSRLALGFPEAQSKNTGWSMVLWKPRKKAQKFKPHLRIKPKDSRSAFINLAGGDPNNRVVYRGRFLDLSVLAWALRNKHMSLNQTLKSFGLKGKMEHEPTGRVTKKELA